MAKPVSEEELQLKKRARRRLIGAIALVAAVAAVLPMVLDSEPKSSSQDINIQIPSPEPKGAVVAKVTPAKPAAPPAAKAETAPAEKTDGKSAAGEKPAAKAPDNPNDAVLFPAQRGAKDRAAEKAPSKAADKPADKAPEKVAEKPKEIAKDSAKEKAPEKSAEKSAEKAPAPKAAPGSFFIQVIALSEAEKAKQVQQQIAGTGIRAYTEEVASGAGKVTRVRAGPFATREEADRAQAKLQGIGLDGRVAAY